MLGREPRPRACWAGAPSTVCIQPLRTPATGMAGVEPLGLERGWEVGTGSSGLVVPSALLTFTSALSPSGPAGRAGPEAVSPAGVSGTGDAEAAPFPPVQDPPKPLS